MKTFGLLASIALLTLLPISSQVNAQMIARDVFEEGMKALQFGIGENFLLDNYLNSTVSFRKYDSDKSARFVNLTFDFRASRLKPDLELERNIDSLANQLVLGLGKMRYLQTSSDVRPFVSRELLLGYFWQVDRERIDSEFTDDTWEKKLAMRGFTAGVAAGIGAEWFPAKNISVFALYRVQASMDVSDLKISETDRQDSRARFTAITLRNSGLLFGLAAFF